MCLGVSIDTSLLGGHEKSLHLWRSESWRSVLDVEHPEPQKQRWVVHMSIKVREWLRRLGIETTHEEREEIDREIERRTGRYCDNGIALLTEAECLAMMDSVRRRRRRASIEPLVA